VAIKTGRHPADLTRENIAAIRGQMQRMGWSIDWTRELSTAEPDYYHWTQWIFLRLLGLAGVSAVGVREWCPVDQTVLANDRSSTAAASAAAVRSSAHAGTVVLQDHRLRRPAAG
jgi:leucyl-tRNA synthetase